MSPSLAEKDYQNSPENHPDFTQFTPINGVLMPHSACSESLTHHALQGKKIQIYSEHDVKKALEAVQERDDGKGTHSNYIKLYNLMLSKSSHRHITIPPDVEYFYELLKASPNHAEVANSIIRRVRLARQTGEPLSLDPILLLGPPGVGKTHFALTLAKILGTEAELISMSSLTAGWVISGAGGSWKDAKPGKIATSLIKGQVANPVFILDEIDKAMSSASSFDPLGAFYSLLEPGTSIDFIDEFVDVSINASHVTWIATANTAESIPDPILNRMNVYQIPQPDKEQTRIIISNIYQKILSQHPLWGFDPQLPDDYIDRISNLAPRFIRRIVEESIGIAYEKGRQHLLVEDLDTLIKEPKKSKSIGFHRP